MTMNKVIAIVLTVVNVFAGVVLWFNWRGVQVQDSLINSFFILYGAELATMGGIKITKVVKERKAIRDLVKRGTANLERIYDGFDEESGY